MLHNIYWLVKIPPLFAVSKSSTELLILKIVEKFLKKLKKKEQTYSFSFRNAIFFKKNILFFYEDFLNNRCNCRFDKA